METLDSTQRVGDSAGRICVAIDKDAESVKESMTSPAGCIVLGLGDDDPTVPDGCLNLILITSDTGLHR
jgi:hypothetical protein